MRVILASLLLVAAGCGSESTALTGPSPILAAPPAVGFRGIVTDTLTGAPVADVTAVVTGSRVLVSAPGYVPRETRADAPAVDLIRESGFDIIFYRQFARSTLSGASSPLRVLRAAPSLLLHASGLSAANVAVLEQAARTTVPALTGDRFQLGAFETSQDVPAGRAGWVVAELVNDASHPCGRGQIGGGRIWLNVHEKCAYQGHRVDPSVLAHELGHALGFDHVSDAGALMSAVSRTWGRVVITDQERRHAAIAYARMPGNRDVDIDP